MDEDFNCEEAAENLRKKYLYRRLILSGKIVLPYRKAAQLVGPDCLYHLYSQQKTKDNPARKSNKRRS